MFGVLGYIFVRLGCEGAPFLLGLVLGPQMEEYFRRAMLLSRGDPMVFLQRPISLGLLITTADPADPDGAAEHQEGARGSVPGRRDLIAPRSPSMSDLPKRVTDLRGRPSRGLPVGEEDDPGGRQGAPHRGAGGHRAQAHRLRLLRQSQARADHGRRRGSGGGDPPEARHRVQRPVAQPAGPRARAARAAACRRRRARHRLGHLLAQEHRQVACPTPWSSSACRSRPSRTAACRSNGASSWAPSAATTRASSRPS